MAVIDLILKIDEELRLKEVICVGECKACFKDHALSDWMGQKIDDIFDISIKHHEGIVEIHRKLFKYQRIKEADGERIYLSREGVLLDLYEQTIKHVSEGVQIFDRNGYFVYGNPASEALENYKNSDFKGKHVLDLYDLKEEYSTILTVLRTQKPVINRCDRFKMRTGKTLTTINTGYPLKMDGHLYGAVVFESDLSVLNRIKNRTIDLESYVESRQKTRNDDLYTFEDIIHTSESMKDTIHFAKKVSLTDSSILIVGPTGTGKELLAQSIHSFSSRRYKPFIDVNCSAIPSNLFESMFFGTEKGAFTGSISNKGFFEMADGGTIFLDEVNSISLEMQAKLLRALQEKRVQRIGGSKYIRCDVRIIAASNESLFELMEQQKMRKDFYYRISTIKIDILPLCNRKEDIPVLARHFLDRLSTQYNRKHLAVSEKALGVFYGYDWPGNIRELQHVIEYMFNRAPEDITELEFEHLPDYLQTTKTVTHSIPRRRGALLSLTGDVSSFDQRMAYFEREIIVETLKTHEYNITRSAKELEMSRQSLQYRMKKLGITEKSAK